ncbi:hypothetical protein J7L13_01850 [bacterium]|nr:hypothetical protein [bacterium]
MIGFDTETYLGKDRRHHFLSFQVYSEDTRIAKVLGRQEPVYDERGMFKGYRHVLSWISYRKEDFLKLMRYSIRNAVFFTFNLDFDIAVVAEILKPLIEEGKVALKLFHSGGRTIMARLKYQDHTVRFLDLKNIFMVRSLAKLGKIVGIEKLQKPPLLGSHQLKELIETNEEVRRLFEAYAIQDAKICFYAGKYILDLIKRPRGTIGSISIHKFFEEYARKPRINRRYVDTLFSFPSYPDSLKAKIKKAYRGGRVEVFKRGTNDEEVRYYDVNSLYPYVMYSNRFPLVNTNKLGRFVNKTSVNLDFDGVALVKVRVEAEVPPLGVKRVCEDKYERLIFPEGRIVDWFTYPELRYLEERGYGKIEKVYEAFEYKIWFYPFRDFISDMYRKRLEYKGKDEVLYKFYKLLMNSLYGKFGEWKNGKWLVVLGDTVAEEVKKQRRRDRFYQNFVWAAYVTAYARLKLHEYLRKVPPDKLYYCDTDSVIAAYNLNHLCGSDLGQLKLEGVARPGRATFVRSKFYIFESAVRLKGFYGVEGGDIIRALLKVGKTAIPQMKIVKFLEARRRHMKPLTQEMILKIFRTDPDYKRAYLKHLSAAELLENLTDSEPKVMSEGGLDAPHS